MKRELKYLGLGFENCDSIKIPICCVKSLSIYYPKKYHKYHSYPEGSGVYLEGEVIESAQIILDYNQMFMLNLRTMNESFTRALKYKDITRIDLYFTEEEDADTSYSVQWEGYDYTNNLQETHHTEEGMINIIINKGKLPYVQK